MVFAHDTQIFSSKLNLSNKLLSKRDSSSQTTSKYKEKLEIKNCKKYQKKERETIKNYTEVEKLQAPSK